MVVHLSFLSLQYHEISDCILFYGVCMSQDQVVRKYSMTICGQIEMKYIQTLQESLSQQVVWASFEHPTS